MTQWFDISETPAPDGELVLVAVSGGIVSMGSCMAGFGWHWEPMDGEDDDAFVTHWTPLPKAPKASHAA